MLIPSWSKFKEPQKVSEASLARIRARERERILSEEADKRHARRKARLDLIIKPQYNRAYIKEIQFSGKIKKEEE